jgi:hypothetical protein
LTFFVTPGAEDRFRGPVNVHVHVNVNVYVYVYVVVVVVVVVVLRRPPPAARRLRPTSDEI